MSTLYDIEDEILEVIDAIAARLKIGRSATVALAVQMLASKLRFPDLPPDQPN